MPENYPDVLSTKDVCKILRISPHTLYELIKHKKLLAMNHPAASNGVSYPGFFSQNAASSGVLNP